MQSSCFVGLGAAAGGGAAVTGRSIREGVGAADADSIGGGDSALDAAGRAVGTRTGACDTGSA